MSRPAYYDLPADVLASDRPHFLGLAAAERDNPSITAPHSSAFVEMLIDFADRISDELAMRAELP